MVKNLLIVPEACDCRFYCVLGGVDHCICGAVGQFIYTGLVYDTVRVSFLCVHTVLLVVNSLMCCLLDSYKMITASRIDHPISLFDLHKIKMCC